MSEKLFGEYDANGRPVYETIYAGSAPVGVMKQTGTAANGDIAVSLYNVNADHIDTPRVITTQDHTIVWRWDTAEAFGGTAPNQNPSGLGTFAYNQRFPGQVFDAETGLFQNWNREYNARLGRYIQSDPIGLEGGINTFTYVESSPLIYVDPLGLQSDGHHWVIGPIRRDPGLSDAARKVFENAKTGPVPGGHNFGNGHADYNRGVKDLWTQHLNQTKIQPCNMTASQAEDFVSKVKTSSDPRIRNFNLKVYNKFMREGFRRMPPRSVE